MCQSRDFPTELCCNTIIHLLFHNFYCIDSYFIFKLKYISCFTTFYCIDPYFIFKLTIFKILVFLVFFFEKSSCYTSSIKNCTLNNLLYRGFSVRLNIAYCVSCTEYCILHYNPCNMCFEHTMFKQTENPQYYSNVDKPLWEHMH